VRKSLILRLNYSFDRIAADLPGCKPGVSGKADDDATDAAISGHDNADSTLS
jgi:hypothetical protein